MELTLRDVGAQGDGLGIVDGVPVYVPAGLVGERVRVRLAERRGDGWEAGLEEILEASPDRVPAVCRHFGTCGGCRLQHMAPERVVVWKRGLLTTALARRGLVFPEPAPLIGIAPGRRRRATFAYVRAGGRVLLGFNVRNQDRIVDLAECPALLPELTALLPPLRRLLAELVANGRKGDVSITATATGVDLVLAGMDAPALSARERLVSFAYEWNLARLSWCGDPGGMAEPVVERSRPRVDFAGVAVEVPPGAFLQPSAEGEAAIVSCVLEGVSGFLPVVDLYAGLGSFTFPLARLGSVHAVEGVAAAVESIRAAAHRAGQEQVSAQVLDLARDPHSAPMLRRFKSLVFDPPRAGARAQVEILAKEGPPRLVAISCDPSTLARDLRILCDGGYRLVSLTPIDQFPWSHHLEAVATLHRG
ncbi:MAG: class I SAM-dependent RNA methyltransferase [Alphaproteobacteria bacterium]